MGKYASCRKGVPRGCGEATLKLPAKGRRGSGVRTENGTLIKTNSKWLVVV